MTTIVYHKGILASDSRESYEMGDCLFFNDNSVKLYEVNTKSLGKAFIAIAGNSNTCDELVNKLSLKKNLLDIRLKASAIILTCKEVLCYKDGAWERQTLKSKRSLYAGTGGSVAAEAIVAGASIFKAIEASKKADRFSGGPIQYVNIFHKKPRIRIKK